MTQDELKQAAAKAAFDYVAGRLEEGTSSGASQSASSHGESGRKGGMGSGASQVENRRENGMVVGVGTGSTTNLFIEELAAIAHRLAGTVASSLETEKRLKAHNIPVFDLNSVGMLDIYVDGADEANAELHLIKGGGAALTREKIIAAASREFLCIADESKLVKELGAFPLPIEVIPMARRHVTRELEALGGKPVYREDCVTDNGNHILDVHHLEIPDPRRLERELNQIVGVVTNGLFATRGADVLLLGTAGGVKTIKAGDTFDISQPVES